jgi:hypothetical protein
MGSNDQEKTKIAREYFMRADQGSPNLLELFHEDAEVLKWLRDSKKSWNPFNTITTV